MGHIGTLGTHFYCYQYGTHFWDTFGPPLPYMVIWGMGFIGKIGTEI